jgi:hypothetical protein
MIWALFLFVVFVVVGTLLQLLVRGGRAGRATDAYRSNKPLSEPEQTLYWRLREAVPECVVLSQVTFSRFMTPDVRGRAQRRALFNRISSKSADFLVCLKDFTLVAAIELDDRSHSRDRDTRRDEILASAGIPVLRFNVKEMPSVERLRTLLTA